MAETRLKIAVFIDFDNIEIGVKTTLGGHFDVGAVLEAIKERGEVVTKIAYGDWTRAGDYSRSLTQHAIHMVQRNLTPGGDKNGADINLALDALEMAFTHSHINAFVIVGGDSDFMALVEKLKQYDRKVFVVGGRAFTSTILQRNCTEFIAYENLVGGSARKVGRGGKAGEASVEKAVPLIRRALKVLADREVSPQLGVLKSTLLQLDSTFSEREYGASTFRDFVQRLARGGYVTLKGTDRNIYVELRDGDGASAAHAALPAARDGETPALDSDVAVTPAAPATGALAGTAAGSGSAAVDADAPASTAGTPGTAAASTPAASLSADTEVQPAIVSPAAPAPQAPASSGGRQFTRVVDEPRHEPRHAPRGDAGASQSQQGQNPSAPVSPSSAAPGTGGGGRHAAPAAAPAQTAQPAHRGERDRDRDRGPAPQGGGTAAPFDPSTSGSAGSAAGTANQAELLRLVLDVFQRPGAVARWPLYLRQVKQLLRAADEAFDERRYGFSGIVEALRYCQREGVFRLDRDRQGVLRVYPGPVLQRHVTAATPSDQEPTDSQPADSLSGEPTAQELFAAPEAAAESPRDADTTAPGEPDDRAQSETTSRDEDETDAPLFAAVDADEPSTPAETASAAAPAAGSSGASGRARKRTAKAAKPPARAAKSERSEKSDKSEKPEKAARKTAAAKSTSRAAKSSRGGARKGTKGA